MATNGTHWVTRALPLAQHKMMPNPHCKVPGNYSAPRLAHKLVCSMAPGTPAKGALDAASLAVKLRAAAGQSRH
jgi:hypothetical protein